MTDALKTVQALVTALSQARAFQAEHSDVGRLDEAVAAGKALIEQLQAAPTQTPRKPFESPPWPDLRPKRKPAMTAPADATLKALEMALHAMMTGLAVSPAINAVNAAIEQMQRPAVQATQDPKYSIQAGQIINAQSGEAIPLDEPVFLFRARDRKAAAVLWDYAERCDDPTHVQAVEARAAEFETFAAEHPDRMKEPDTAASSAAPPEGQQAVRMLDWAEVSKVKQQCLYNGALLESRLIEAIQREFCSVNSLSIGSAPSEPHKCAECWAELTDAEIDEVHDNAREDLAKSIGFSRAQAMRTDTSTHKSWRYAFARAVEAALKGKK